MSYRTTRPVASSSTPATPFSPRLRGPMPEMNSRLPTRRACGYGPSASGARAERITADVMAATSILDAHVACFGEKAHGFETAFTAQARVLHSAHRGAQIAQHPGVDPHETRLEARGDPVAALDVAAPDRSRETIRRAVRDPQRIGLIAERLERRDRAKNFLLVRGAFRLQPVDHGGLVKPALPAARCINRCTLAATQYLSAVGARLLYGRHDFLEVNL